MSVTEVEFDGRFLDKHAGSIITDIPTAVAELVANAWDAYATEVEITWPDRHSGSIFSIRDNGLGMTQSMFERRWSKLDYNRDIEQGGWQTPPDDLEGYQSRKVYGRNGRGRHAAFRFSDPYTVTTWRDGVELTYEVRRGGVQPFEISLIDRVENVDGHGTLILATEMSSVNGMTVEDIREIIGVRFLADPNFKVSVDGIVVSFEDLSASMVSELDVDVFPFGRAHLVIVDAVKADKSTRNHGIAWRVYNRLVGTPGWTAFDQERLLDGRKTEAKRYQVIVQADFLEDSVLEDWSAFRPTSEPWRAARSAVHKAVLEFLATSGAAAREETKEAIRERYADAVTKMPPSGRARWADFVDQVVEKCPTISSDDIRNVSGILANLEIASSKYALLGKLNGLPPDDLDALHQILEDWTVRLAKDALDEIQSRLRLISELERKLNDPHMDEVGDLQPLIEKSLWVFGPEFESLEFTSNRGMTTVIRELFGSNDKGSLLRPDFVVLPDASVGFYGRDSYDSNYEVVGIGRLVIVEIKKPNVPIGSDEKEQPWRYVKELMKKGYVTHKTKVDCFVLGAKIESNEGGQRVEADGAVTIQPLIYSHFIRRAEARMLGLRQKLISAPFLLERGIDGQAFVTAVAPQQPLLFPDVVT